MEYLIDIKDSLSLNLGLFNFFSIIDILIVAYVLYRLMLLIRGTRAVQLLKGLGVLLAATFLSNLLNLNTVHWLLKQSMTMLLVALPIVFHPELRRALEKIGGGDFFARPLTQMPEGDRSALIDMVVQAAQYMSATKTGALIVLERKTGLQELIDTGLKIDALVSAELLENIFINKSPLHDGAVIIRGDRLVAASCLLPLSESRELVRELGTRHRAALGLAEQSDALIIVVSEETGQVSLVLEDIFQRSLDSDELRGLIGKFLKQELYNDAISSFWKWR